MTGVANGQCYRLADGQVVVVREVLLNQVRIAYLKRGNYGGGQWRPLAALESATLLPPTTRPWAHQEYEVDGFGNHRKGR